MRRLDLDREQRSRIHALASAHRRQMSERHLELADLRDAIEREWEEDEPSEGRLVATLGRIHDLEKEMSALDARHRLAVLAVLTPAQRTELRELWRSRARRMPGPAGRPPHPPPGAGHGRPHPPDGEEPGGGTGSDEW